jgi:acyl-homoserine lactone acylase PvdQ
LKRVALSSLLVFVALVPAANAARLDFGKQTYNGMPPGQSGALVPDRYSTDQLRIYDALTPLFDDVTGRTIKRLFKPAGFFAPKGGTVSRPKRGVEIRRDRQWGVPHIEARTRSDVYWGIGWVAAQDRGLLMETLRYPARFTILDAPGKDALELATSLRQFTPSPQTERRIASQRRLLAGAGPRGRRIIKDFEAYVAGVNAYNRSQDNGIKPWNIVDVISVTGLLGQVFGAGGGDEVRNSMLLAELRNRLGPGGDAVWRDLRSAQDPETSVTTDRRFAYTTQRGGRTPGSLVVDPGSMSASAAKAAEVAMAARARASNAVLVGRSRSATGHPLAVMGPQLGYFYPELFFEVDAHGGGIHVRGGALPGIPYVLIGRGRDYAWGATSASNDNTDQFVEELCNPDGSPPTRASDHYRFRGRCRPMRTFNAGVLAGAAGAPDEQVTFRETLHGPVSGTVTVGGRPYAVTTMRSSRGREITGAYIGEGLARLRSASDLPRVASRFAFTFNLFYIDHKDIGFFSSGRLPIRAPGTDPSLPTLGTGQYEWRGFLKTSEHPQDINPENGLLLNWNNKPAAGFGAADNNWTYQSVHRNDLFTGFKRRNQLHDVLSVVNRAATQDLRAVHVWPVIREVLGNGTAQNTRSQQAVVLVDAWVRRGASRLDRDLDGRIDDPGAAVLDQTWDALSEAVLRPVLGDLAASGGLLGQLIGRDDSPRTSNGSSYGGGWYGYVDKDLRSLLGKRVRGPYSRPYCGGGDLAACRASLWAVIQQGTDALAGTQGADPAAWRSDATEERIAFVPGLLGQTMRWTNRPTLHQLMEFDGHRPTLRSRAPRPPRGGGVTG